MKDQHVLSRAGHPVTALTTWLGAAAITDGAALRPISKGNRAHQTRHRSLATVGTYVRNEEAWADNGRHPAGAVAGQHEQRHAISGHRGVTAEAVFAAGLRGHWAIEAVAASVELPALSFQASAATFGAAPCRTVWSRSRSAWAEAGGS